MILCLVWDLCSSGACFKFADVLSGDSEIQGGSNMTGTNCDLFTHKSSRSYLNHLVVVGRKQ
jgi:hypothetical protein